MPGSVSRRVRKGFVLFEGSVEHAEEDVVVVDVRFIEGVYGGNSEGGVELEAVCERREW